MIENGLWHQVRVDHGREFNLVLKIQDYLRTIRGPHNNISLRAITFDGGIFYILKVMIIVVEFNC